MPSALQVEAILRALGCDDAGQRAGGCTHCFGLNEDLSLRTDVDSFPSPSRMEIVLGRFAEAHDLAAMVTVAGCSDRASGDNDVSLIGFDGTNWAPVARWSFNDNARCVYPRRADGREHIVCAVNQGSQGCYDTELDSPRALPLEGALGPQADEDCAGRVAQFVGVDDVDGDGDEDIQVSVDGAMFLLRQGSTEFVTESP